ncbi:hypothetical protein N825_20110 [Skermanella stibiiresistens SB22]|uniref:ABC transporter substrate-binding protein n=1 Tax=Skermanella stibiiresistens SB22 TaxID=1385369 RepID=W9HBV3_9PROT|nr:DUF2076 domain-containing protein [Skermanella stibiiresistens]EWY42201.1 hypothetical protein N825_20110 [Skermanella stibiiresistens SB22]
MDQNERQIIDELFGKLRQAETQSGPRDAQAESFIREQVARQPAAPYLMAQAIVIQEQALAASQARIQQLEQEAQERPAAAAGGGGLFGSLFGGGAQRQPAAAPRGNSPWGQAAQTPPGDPRVAAYADPRNQQRQGGGFMAGAMQTAMGVAGGMLIGNALGSMFSGGEAMAEDAVGAVEEQIPEEIAPDDGGDFFGGDEEF